MVVDADRSPVFHSRSYMRCLDAAVLECEAHDEQPFQAQVPQGNGSRGPQSHPHASPSKRPQPWLPSGEGAPHEPPTSPTGRRRGGANFFVETVCGHSPPLEWCITAQNLYSRQQTARG